MKAPVIIAVLLTASAVATAGVQLSAGVHTCESSPVGNPHTVNITDVPGPPPTQHLDNGDNTGPYVWNGDTGRYENGHGYWYEFTQTPTTPPVTTWTYGGPGGPTASGQVFL